VIRFEVPELPPDACIAFQAEWRNANGDSLRAGWGFHIAS
jgi:hypothetical protein